MIKLTATVHNRFGKHLALRVAKWRTADLLVARVRAPLSLKWWYWVEYGTALYGDPGKASGHTYTILPVNAKALRFPGPGGSIVLADSVTHSGIHPRRPVRLALRDVGEGMLLRIHKAVERGALDNPLRISDVILDSTKRAKDLIVASMERVLPGSREDGRLEGRTAAEVFAAEAVVETVSGGE